MYINVLVIFILFVISGFIEFSVFNEEFLLLLCFLAFFVNKCRNKETYDFIVHCERQKNNKNQNQTKQKKTKQKKKKIKKSKKKERERERDKEKGRESEIERKREINKQNHISSTSSCLTLKDKNIEEERAR